MLKTWMVFLNIDLSNFVKGPLGVSWKDPPLLLFIKCIVSWHLSIWDVLNMVVAVLTTLANLLTSKWASRIQCCVLQCIWKVVMEPVFRTSHFYHGFEPHFRKSHWLCDSNTSAFPKMSIFWSSTLARCLLRKRANCFQQVRPCVPLGHESQNVRCSRELSQWLSNKLLQLVPCLV